MSVSQSLVKSLLYTCDHRGFLHLTEECYNNRWTPAQIVLNADSTQVSLLNEPDLEFYKFLFTFLAVAEKLVNINIEVLTKHFDLHDILHYYTEQEAMENIHGKVYANILNMFFDRDQESQLKYTLQVINDAALLKKIGWLNDRVNSASERSHKILIFLLIEGIFFVASFYSISLLRGRGLMSNVCLANDYISRDEGLHTRAAALLYNTVIPSCEKPDNTWINSLFKEAVDIEYEFIKVKGHGVTGIDLDQIRQFLEAAADAILSTIHLPPLFNTPPPDCPMFYICYTKNTNFFERENSDYMNDIQNDL
ncbi:core gene UL40 family [Phascolarctid gammaherpesvirus 1]|uniref:ribonucleoside-diphosphate reductase n=1 Tax=Phascolarctid gammaherpesvirus 1 TaxID=2249313 RepID=A0A3S8D7S7_9GAMA|nr:core gene UL40 family [Phascolarctid gammaherpesvirus 1]AZB49232.1 core gene UL40 family [Phascolarctid gammaherpesvirus 1]